KRKRVCIISKDHELVRKYIVESLNRGCSLYEVKGGYSGEVNIEIQTLLTQEEFGNLMSMMRSKGIPAFITAGNVSEIYGLWNNQKHHKTRKVRPRTDLPD
ncbi:MAG: DUF2179 domain-containing protein, partial [Bacteroidales bacterium]|nr:DUF2179 domain-containing protein [Bacteroidales bacterium]